MEPKEKLFSTHVFVCTNSKPSGIDCASKGSIALRDNLKARGKSKWGKNVRINASGCLGQCENGIAVVCYPTAKWQTNVTPNDIDSIEKWIDDEVQKSKPD